MQRIMVRIDSGDFEVGHQVFGPVIIPEAWKGEDWEWCEERIQELFQHWKNGEGAPECEPDTDEEFINWLVRDRGFSHPPKHEYPWVLNAECI